MILVTNYENKIYGKPINEVMPTKRIIFNEKSMALTINECVSVGIFEEVPYMRNTPVNKTWFEQNIYHLR